MRICEGKGLNKKLIRFGDPVLQHCKIPRDLSTYPQDGRLAFLQMLSACASF